MYTAGPCALGPAALFPPTPKPAKGYKASACGDPAPTAQRAAASDTGSLSSSDTETTLIGLATLMLCSDSTGTANSSGSGSPLPTGAAQAMAVVTRAEGPSEHQQLRQLQAAASAASKLLFEAEYGAPGSQGLRSDSPAASSSFGAGWSFDQPLSLQQQLACPQACVLPIQQQQQQQLPQAVTGSSNGTTSTNAEPPLAVALGVSVASLERLFRAGGQHDFEQPVWMVVNLQGKIKGSYTAEKMIEFCKRGTLSARQMVLGIDRDLPYMLRQVRASKPGGVGVNLWGWNAHALSKPCPSFCAQTLTTTPNHSRPTRPKRQEMSFYRPLGTLAVEVHQGGRYVPLSDARAKATSPPWAPVVPRDAPEDGLAASLASLTVSESDNGASSQAGPSSSTALRVSLQRLFTPSGPGAKRQPMWLYINHLGWCRG